MIVIYGSNWCGDCRRVKQLLQENGILFDWVNIDSDRKAEQFVLKTNNGMRSVPTILFEDGSILVEPTNSELVAKLHLSDR